MSNQYKDLVAYDSSEPIYLIAQVQADKSVSEHVVLLTINKMPSTLISNSKTDSNFRDAVLHNVIDTGSNALDVIVQAVKSERDDSNDLPVLCEYAAAIAYAQGNTELAKAVVLRLSPTTQSSLIKNIAVGLANGMKAETFKGLLQSSTAMSASLMQN
jgi:hypothetical protein